MAGSAMNAAAGFKRPPTTTQRRVIDILAGDTDNSGAIEIAGLGMTRVAVYGSLVLDSGSFTSLTITVYTNQLAQAVSGKGVGDIVSQISVVPGTTTSWYEAYPLLLAPTMSVGFDLVGAADAGTLTLALLAAQ